MYFTPKTDEQLEAERPRLKEGICDFEVISSELKNGLDKKSNPPKEYQYFQLNIKVYDCDGTHAFVTEFLASNQVWKLKQFCDASGLEERYNNPPLECFHINGATGRCMTYWAKNKDPQYGDQLKIKSYINPKKEAKSDMGKQPVSSQTSSMANFDNDDIPF